MQGQDVLHGHNGRAGATAVEIGDGPVNELLRRAIHVKTQFTAELEAAYVIDFILEPADEGVIVVGPRVDDRVRLRIEAVDTVWPFVHVEFEDLHTWQAQGLLQPADIVGDDAQVFGDEGHRIGRAPDPAPSSRSLRGPFRP